MAFFDFLRGNRVPTDLLAQGLAETFRNMIAQTSILKEKSAAKRIAMNILVPQMAALTLGAYWRAGANQDQQDKGELHEQLNYGLFSGMTGYEGFAAIFNNLLDRNNAFCRINRAGAKLINLTVLDRTQVAVVVSNGTCKYLVDSAEVSPDTIWHVKANTYNGLVGTPFEDEVNSFALAKEAEDLAKRYFSQGGTIARIWKLLPGATPDQEKAIQEFITAAISGRLNQAKDVVVPMLVDKVADAGGITPRDGQMIEGRQFQQAEILALYGIDLKSLDLELIYNLSIVPMLEMVEQSITRYLLNDQQRATYRVKYIEAGRFRGSTQKQYEMADKALKFQSVNEVRQWFRLPSKGGTYDAVVNPNTASAGVNEQRQADATKQ